MNHLDNFWNEVYTYLFGQTPLSAYFSGELFALMALILSLWLHSQKRDPDSPNTPKEFSWRFLIWDNAKRIVVGQIAIYLVFRFYPEIFHKEMSMWGAVGIGFALSFGLDKFIQAIQENSNIFDRNRSSFMAKVPVKTDE